VFNEKKKESEHAVMPAKADIHCFSFHLFNWIPAKADNLKRQII